MLYLVKHLRPDIANATWEENVMDGANQVAFLEMHNVIKYALNTRNIRLKIEQNGNKNESWDNV